MKLSTLVKALLSGDLLTARQIVADVQREKLSFEQLQQPEDLSEHELIVAAAVVELLAARGHVDPPTWTRSIGALPTPLVLDPGLQHMPRSFARAQAAGPEPFRRRNIVALPDFLDVA